MNDKPVAVLISDIHYNPTNLELADKSLRAALEEAERLEVPLVIAGDLHDTKAILRGECVNAMITTFKLCPKVKKIILVGNHCRINERSKEHSLNFLAPYAHIVEYPEYNSGLKSWLIPYFHDADQLHSVLVEIPDDSRLIMHQGVQGAHMGAYVIDKTSLPREVFEDFRVISGHYHRPQDIKCGRPRKGAVGLFTYIGSPYTISFAEAEDGPKGFRVLYENGIAEIKPLNLRKHIIVTRTIDSLLNPIKEYKSGDLVWLKVTGSRLELDKLKKNEIGSTLFGHSNFKLDKIPTDSAKAEIITNKLDTSEILDKLVDDLGETADTKVKLKTLWRDILE